MKSNRSHFRLTILQTLQLCINLSSEFNGSQHRTGCGYGLCERWSLQSCLHELRQAAFGIQSLLVPFLEDLANFLMFRWKQRTTTTTMWSPSRDHAHIWPAQRGQVCGCSSPRRRPKRTIIKIGSQLFMQFIFRFIQEYLCKERKRIRNVISCRLKRFS